MIRVHGTNPGSVRCRGVSEDSALFRHSSAQSPDIGGITLTDEAEAGRARRSPPEIALQAADATERLSWRELVNGLPAAIYMTDAVGRITFFNEAAAALWGREPVIGESDWCGSWRLYHPD